MNGKTIDPGMRTVMVVLSGILPIGTAFGSEPPEGPYRPDWPSLQKHQAAPEWFRDAKYGIYMHWGVYSVPAFGSEWYPRNMHIKSRKEHEHHGKTYGDPAKFGYHDFVPRFRAEHFDPEEWAKLFADSGAKYAGLVAEHHDGFAMWDSELTPWNAKDMGPKRDITGDLAKAVRNHGMRFVATFHHARNNQHMINKDGKLVWTGHYPRVEGWPTVSEDPKLRMLYGNLPRNRFLELWKGKLFEVIDRYRPDLIWFDSWLDEIPETYHTAFLAHYLNRAHEWDKQVVVTCKQRDLPFAVAVEDFEKGRAGDITDHPFLTDDTISYGSWCYTKDLRIKPLSEVLHTFIDIVSKNGQLLLNLSPKADGTIPDDQRKILMGLGKWLRRNGEAIYGTRPFVTFGEGPTKMRKAGHFVGRVRYRAEDIRFTRKGDRLFAVSLGAPKGQLKIRTLGRAKMPALQIHDVALLGSNNKLKWSRDDACLRIEIPEGEPGAVACAFGIRVSGTAAACTGIKQQGRHRLVAEIRCLRFSEDESNDKCALFVDGKAVAQANLPPAGKEACVVRLEGRTTGTGLHDVRVRIGDSLLAERTYSNGAEAGPSGRFPPHHKTARLVRSGESNLTAIRVYDHQGRGGLHRDKLGPVEPARR